jgi:hypothetical protein
MPQKTRPVPGGHQETGKITAIEGHDYNARYQQVLIVRSPRPEWLDALLPRGLL